MRNPHVASLLTLIGLSVLPASAEQTALDCNKAVANYQAVTEFDKEAVKEGLQICGTPAMMAREQMRVACLKVRQSVSKE